MSVTLKQTIENHPVVLYSTAVVVAFAAGATAGVFLYKGSNEPNVRIPISTEKYEALVTEYSAAKRTIDNLETQLKAGASRPSLEVKFSTVKFKANSGCPANAPVAVAEYYDIGSEVDENRAILIIRDTLPQMVMYKVNDTGAAFRTDPSRRGWTFNYCEAASSRIEYVRLFINPLTGAASKPIKVAFET